MTQLNARATMSNVLSARATLSQVVQGSEPPTGDAIVDQVLEGATFSNAADTGLTGTMPNIGQQNITPSAEDQAISEGYHDGTGVVSGDADLIAENIKKDVTIFGVTGTVEPQDLSPYEAALDAVNEEPSADLDAGIALVASNYSATKAAIAANGVDMTGVKPSGYNTKITEAVETKEREAWFMFDAATKTLYGYNSINGPKDMVIPASINGAAVEIIAASAFQIINAALRMTGAYFPDSVKTIQNQILYGQTLLASIRLPQNPLFTAIPNNFAWNSRITVLDVPTSVLSIGSQAVYGNPVFAELIAPSVTSIGASAFYFTPLIKITIGANCTITSNAQNTMGNFGVAFEALYNSNGKLAGTYEYIAGAWTKTA